MIEEYNKYVPNDAMSCGDTLMYNAERLANGEVVAPEVVFYMDATRRDGSTALMRVSIVHASQAAAEVSFAGRPKSPSWYEEVKE